MCYPCMHQREQHTVLRTIKPSRELEVERIVSYCLQNTSTGCVTLGLVGFACQIPTGSSYTACSTIEIPEMTVRQTCVR